MSAATALIDRCISSSDNFVKLEELCRQSLDLTSLLLGCISERNQFDFVSGFVFLTLDVLIHQVCQFVFLFIVLRAKPNEFRVFLVDNALPFSFRINLLILLVVVFLAFQFNVQLCFRISKFCERFPQS